MGPLEEERARTETEPSLPRHVYYLTIVGAMLYGFGLNLLLSSLIYRFSLFVTGLPIILVLVVYGFCIVFAYRLMAKSTLSSSVLLFHLSVSPLAPVFCATVPGMSFQSVLAIVLGISIFSVALAIRCCMVKNPFYGDRAPFWLILTFEGAALLAPLLAGLYSAWTDCLVILFFSFCIYILFYEASLSSPTLKHAIRSATFLSMYAFKSADRLLNILLLPVTLPLTLLAGLFSKKKEDE